MCQCETKSLNVVHHHVLDDIRMKGLRLSETKLTLTILDVRCIFKNVEQINRITLLRSLSCRNI